MSKERHSPPKQPTVRLSLAERTINRIFYEESDKEGLARDKEVFDILNEAFEEAKAEALEEAIQAATAAAGDFEPNQAKRNAIAAIQALKGK